jgi:PAS domain S-box-containing protein
MKRITLFPKLLLAFLALSLPPLLWLSTDASSRIAEIGKSAEAEATGTLAARASQSLELQAVQLSGEVSRFLEDRVQDLRILRDLPPDPAIFLAFSKGRRGEVWSRGRSASGGVAELHESLPLYSEVSFVGADGRELFRIEGDRQVSPEALRDVSDPKNTTFGVEDYFEAVRSLPDGEPYVGHVVGRHVSKEMQLGGAPSIEEAVGTHYDGHVRLALARRENGRFAGAVVLALDHRHLLEFTQHVLPLSRERVVFPSYLSGNYAFLFDDEGWIITHPKLWDIRGLDEKGDWVPPYSRNSSEEDIKKGLIPFRLDDAGFVDPNYPLAADSVREGRSGVTRTQNVSGVDKVMAYAPIKFNLGSYAGKGIFGGVTIGSQTEGFQREAARVGTQISAASQETLRTGFLLAWSLVLTVTAAALLLSRAITGPIRKVALMARRISAGELSARVEERWGDEVGDLANDFDLMAQMLEEKDTRLMGSLEELGRSRDDTRAYADRLLEQLRILGHIQSISAFLGTTFDRGEVLNILLRTCVEELGFDRAAIYLLDSDRRSLRLLDWAGSPSGETSHPFEEVLPLDSKSLPSLAVSERQTRQGTVDGFKLAWVPMISRDTVVGAMVAQSGQKESPVPENMMGALQIVGGQAARAIERARLFEAVNREREFVEAVVSSVASGIITLDSNGGVLSVNPYAKRILGIGEEAVGNVFSSLPVDRSLVEWVEKVLGEPSPETAEFEIATPEGRAVLIWAPSRFQTEGGQGLILQFRDVTAEKAMDRELERVDRLASLGRLAAGVAHEVRNPLTGVSLILDDLHDRLKAEGDREVVAGALREIERLEGLVQSMLDYARVGTVDKRTVSLGEVVKDSLFLVNKTGRSQGVSMELEIEEDCPQVLADPDKLKQALLNFYINALQAMPGGGRLAVWAGQSQGWALIRISDTGHGIPQEDLERIFEPFYTLKPGGSGLGLSIAHTIVTDHGGRVEVKSAINEGTEVRIFLPVAAV